MNDIRTQLPKCPLAYQVPHIPGGHTAIVIDIDTHQIDWQARMLPWTLASLINNTDIVMKGVHLYVHCEEVVSERIADATAKIEIQNTGHRTPDSKILIKGGNAAPLVVLGAHGCAYDSVCLLDINYWALRDRYNTAKLPLGHVLRRNWGWGAADYTLNAVNPSIPTQHTEYAEPSKAYRDGYVKGWLGTANHAVYGPHAKRESVSGYFCNESEPNWHINTSILQYPAIDVNDPRFTDWASERQGLEQDTLILLWLLKTRQHAYNFRESFEFEYPTFTTNAQESPRLCNMAGAAFDAFKAAIAQLQGAHVNIAIGN